MLNRQVCADHLSNALQSAHANSANEYLCCCSTLFLMGPIKQLKKMFDKGRIVATTTYLVAMCLTLWAALKACTSIT